MINNSKIFIKLKLSIFLVSLIIFSGCIEKNTTNPKEVYSYWLKSDNDSKIKVINGQYWESSHFTYEYIIYLELKVSENWWINFSKENNLILDILPNKPIFNSDFPKWFKPTSEFLKYKPKKEIDQECVYFYNPKNQSVFIYEIQL